MTNEHEEQQKRSLSWLEFLIERAIQVSGVSAIALVVLIFLFLIKEGAPAFFKVPLSSLFAARWYPIESYFGLLPLVMGSMIVTIGAAVVSLPLGLATAIFIAEIAPDWVRDILKPFVEVLAGIPSVVIGFIGMLVFAPLIRVALDIPTGLTAFTGVLLLAWMALPTVVSVAEDVLDAVPKTYRDAGLALGMTRWQVIWRIVLPAGRSGVLMALMLGVGRAIGETMTVMMVTGNAARIPTGLRDFFMPVRTMTATIAAEMGEVAQGSPHYHVLFAVGLTLFVITFIVNMAAASVVFRQVKRAERMLA
ncbi:MAG TPA: phosphate ABC transporter permease subunit PstC [Anaerolineae bacterium]|nr:phosphate ABC transporter permease subunit PstC [Anaerolineae bacterium]HQI87288.1 phosphate ABC transporter permease subunit PstC [Anaerolineae bacterium]